MSEEYSLEELAAEVQQWAERRGVRPASGQAGEEITERTIRYYRTLGLLDAPIGGYEKRFTRKHKLQIIAIRVLQSRGLPLRRIRDELYGKDLDELAAIERAASRAGREPSPFSFPFVPPAAAETWSVTPLAGDYLLVSRSNKPPPRAILEKINELLSSGAQTSEPAGEQPK